MDETREQRERAVSVAVRAERAAWEALERISGPSSAEGDLTDELALRTARERWQAASHGLIEALEALKSVER